MTNLYSESEETIPVDIWEKAQDIARQFGWKPKGTVYVFGCCMLDPDWNGAYLPAEKQLITPEDGENFERCLAEALKCDDDTVFMGVDRNTLRAIGSLTARGNVSIREEPLFYPTD